MKETHPYFENWLQREAPGISFSSAKSVLNLTKEGATVPFIARYRKEATQGLNEVEIQKVLDENEKFTFLMDRKDFIEKEIEKQGKLTDELKASIQNTFDASALEDLYLPYKVKRKSKAQQAKEAGLTPLADWIWDIGHGTVTAEPGQTLEIWAFTFKNEEKGFPDSEKCQQGAYDILVERVSENAELRQYVRDAVFNRGHLKSVKTDKAKTPSKYEGYFTYLEKLENLKKPENSHRYLAIKRGWIEEELKISIVGPGDDPKFEEELQNHFETAALSHTKCEATIQTLLLKAAKTALKVHVLPSIENEAHKAIKEIADETAIQVFAQNVKKLLLASPYGSKAVLGVDPGIRTGCKLAAVNSTGKFIADTVIHLQTDEQKNKARVLIPELLKVGEISAVAVGNGTAGRETEVFFRQIIKDSGSTIPVYLVSESGASVYSASEVAREEFPDLDLTVRGAISIARRLQDPLAELVKVDPKSIGVGQYQHDVSPNALKKSLDFVVDSCVNHVGVHLNTASYHLLARVSGIGESLAKNIMEFRTTNGLFKSRADLKKVPRFSTKAFELAAGFLRVPESEMPLDHTGVHPEQYEALEKVASENGKKISDLLGDSGVRWIRSQEKVLAQLRKELGNFSLEDVLKELEKPGRDPRPSFIQFSFREDLFELAHVKPGMMCPGIVTNVTNFGAFVDIGVHQDGLVHLSQLSNRFIKDPREVVNPGDRVTVKVLDVQLEKKQISLTMNFQTESVRESKPKFEREAPRERKPAPANHRDRVTQNKFNTPGKGVVRTDPSLLPQPKTSPVKPPQPITQFKNNPFAALAGLKKEMKK